MLGAQCSPIPCLRIVGQIYPEQWNIPEPENGKETRVSGRKNLEQKACTDLSGHNRLRLERLLTVQT